jgi:hypothetical protein
MNSFARQVSATIVLVVIAAVHVRSLAGQAIAGSPADSTTRQSHARPAGTRHALIACGLTGDGAHSTLFGGTVETLYNALTTHHGFAPDRVTVLWSDPKGEKEGPAISASRVPPTREGLAETVTALVATVQPEDVLWVFVLGHAHYDGKNCWLNIPGPDVNQTEFGNLFSGIQCAEQVFCMTTAASGFFVKPLSKQGRIVIAATEADREVNETIFPHKLTAALADPPPFLEFDMDGDGRLSLLDLYLRAARQTAEEYATETLLATEHAQLDDNGDGRATELQVDFLPEELGGRLTAERKATLIVSGDGALARRMLLAYPPSPPSPDVRPE